MSEFEGTKKSNDYSLGENSFAAKRIESGLYIVSTPIGNLGDITIRALETLAASDLIACEDTRVTGGLLHRFGIKTKMMIYNEHNSDKQRPHILEALENGKVVSLVSDAGTPLISDPGYRLVNDIVENGHRVFPIPGASAMLTGLVGSGLPSDAILFAGFLPQKSSGRKKRLDELKDMESTLVFYESPHRIGACLKDMEEAFGADRKAVVARELTKRFETFERGTLGTLSEQFSKDRTKGEIVILIAPGQAQLPDSTDADRLLKEALTQMPVSTAAKKISKLTGVDRKTLYARALEFRDKLNAPSPHNHTQPKD
ncbi:16S rRNA (cytidine(1402)-2'-O)-methyltransferase [Flexibacterium corallicola]|uniref:16S rRNA (cytidine(1402)-2'-O)-methyltransferase n=1 Tax=Flexibacterium corallicola TaxID=3037259 RepID=UPI00286F4C0D|nr:16S rRNA (cytidine(1402)-2'-O)-methyltransferase [Pseudovibrio sp. M1P-2-3]